MLCKFKEYQDNTNSGLKKFTCFYPGCMPVLLGGRPNSSWNTSHIHVSYQKALVVSVKKKICTLHKLTIEIGYIMPTWYMKHDLYYRKVI